MDTRICPRCQTENDLQAENCRACGYHFNSKDTLTEDGQKKYALRNKDEGNGNLDSPAGSHIYPHREISGDKLDPALPRSRPSRKKRAAIRLVKLSLIIATTLFILLLVRTFFAPGMFVHRLFFPSDAAYQIIIPATILFLFVYSIFDLLFKMRRIEAEKVQLRKKEVLQLPQLVRRNPIKEVTRKFRAAVNSPDDRKFPRSFFRGERVYHRLYDLLIQLKSTSDLHKSHELFRHQTEIESDDANSEYTTVRIFIWAMPILGFIGTVLGIGLAIGDFSGFLTGDIEQVDVVKDQLSMVASGLSYAFDTTLLGLVGSLFAMLFASFVQKSEEDMMTRLDELGLQVLSNVRTESQEMSPANVQQTIIDELSDFKAAMAGQTDSFSTAMQQFTGFFKESSDSFAKAFQMLPEKIARHEEQLISQLNQV
ncbi:MAG: MotA/TolQ/ExbB proton channel family protein, partial [Calditrichia bacterium]